MEKLLYFVLIAVSNRDGVSFYSDERLAEILEIRHAHELTGARNELMDRGLIAFEQRHLSGSGSSPRTPQRVKGAALDLAPWIADYATYLESNGYASHAIDRRLKHLNYLNRFIEARGLQTLEEFRSGMGE